MAALHQPKYAVYLCEHARDIAAPRQRMYHFIVKFRGVIPKEIFLNIVGLANFENATCAEDLSLVHPPEDAFLSAEAAVKYVRSQNFNNAIPMSAVHVIFFKINPGVVPFKITLNNSAEIYQTLTHAPATDEHIPNTDDETYTVSSPLGLIGSQFDFIYNEGGARPSRTTREPAFKTQTVAALKALCKKRGIRGVSRMTKAELIQVLRRRS